MSAKERKKQITTLQMKEQGKWMMKTTCGKFMNEFHLIHWWINKNIICLLSSQTFLITFLALFLVSYSRLKCMHLSLSFFIWSIFNFMTKKASHSQSVFWWLYQPNRKKTHYSLLWIEYWLFLELVPDI